MSTRRIAECWEQKLPFFLKSLNKKVFQVKCEFFVLARQIMNYILWIIKKQPNYTDHFYSILLF